MTISQSEMKQEGQVAPRIPHLSFLYSFWYEKLLLTPGHMYFDRSKLFKLFLLKVT